MTLQGANETACTAVSVSIVKIPIVMPAAFAHLWSVRISSSSDTPGIRMRETCEFVSGFAFSYSVSQQWRVPLCLGYVS